MNTPNEMMNNNQPHFEAVNSRRDFLLKSGTGFGALALAHLLGVGDAQGSAAKPPHFAPTAKSVIFLFMEGGPSHIDLFDPKPALKKYDGQPLPPSFGKVITAMGEANAPLLASPRTWKQYGKSGIWVSEWLPEIAGCVDDIAVIRSCISDGLNHSGGVCQMNTGSTIGGRPSLGSWVSYGLGTENENLPSYVVMLDNKSNPTNGPRNWGAGFMPAEYQGVKFGNSDEPIPHLNTPDEVYPDQQKNKLSFLNRLNKKFMQQHKDESELDARIQNYELAFRMQAEAPEAVDLSREPEHIKELYGLNEDATEAFGKNCLMARRLVERGVRFIQLYSGSGSKWDAHSDIEGNHSRLCRSSDKPVAGLLKDLKQRGLLDETLVVWGGEFGRTPMSEKGDGRDHNPTGFTMWMAGGGIKGGQVIGNTDEIGLHAIEDRLHVHDLHASILFMLGIRNLELKYTHKGRPETPTINEGSPCMKLLG
jgi:hypothetical protein